MRKSTNSTSGLFNPRVILVLAFCLAGASLAVLGFAATRAPQANTQTANATAQRALATLQNANQSAISVHVSRETGNYNFVSGGILAADKTSDTPQKRAVAFLATHGALVGINDAERAALNAGGRPTTGSDLQIARSNTDSIGLTHVRLNQSYQGLPVFGAQLVVHMNNRGITAVNGDYVPGISFV